MHRLNCDAGRADGVRTRRIPRTYLVRACAIFVASASLACSDSVAPFPTASELTVRIDSSVVHVRRSDAYNGVSYNVWVPYTVINSSGEPLFYNSYCPTRWEKQDGASWVPVGVMDCHSVMFRSIAPYGTQSFGVGKGVGGPNVPVPDFAQPGTYRLVLFLYLDGRGTKPIPDDVSTSNTFQVMN